jgi:dolichyl-phosphate-mannose-protein mannosyltransferase
MSKRNHRLLLAAIVVATFVPLLWTAGWFDRFDSVEYVQLSQTWWPKAGQPFQPYLHEKRLPFFPILIALANRLVPDPSLAAKLLTRACGSALVVACFALVVEVVGTATAAIPGLVAALLVASCPHGLFLAGFTYPLPLFALLVVLATHAVVRHVRSGRLRPLVAANFVVAVACFTRPEGFAVVPPLLWLDARAAWRGSAGSRVGIAAGVLAQATAAAYFLRHFFYGAIVAETVRSGGFVRHLCDWIAGYLQLLPSLCSYTAFAFVLIGAFTLFRRLRRGELDPGQRAFLFAAAWTFVVVLIGISSYDVFVGAYLYSPLPLALCVGAIGVERVAAAFARPALVRTLLLLAILAVNVPFAVANFQNFANVLADEHDCAVWLKENIGIDKRGRQEIVLAIDPNHITWWTGLTAHPYQRDHLEKGHKVRWVVLDDLILQHFQLDFDTEIDWLCRERGARVVHRAETDVRPIFATTYCQPYSKLFTPEVLPVRFDLHHFRSAVLELPR